MSVTVVTDYTSALFTQAVKQELQQAVTDEETGAKGAGLELIGLTNLPSKRLAWLNTYCKYLAHLRAMCVCVCACVRACILFLILTSVLCSLKVLDHSC